MSSNYNNHLHDEDTFSSYISNIAPLTSDDILTEMTQAELAELAIWENAQFNNIDLNTTLNVGSRFENSSPSFSTGFIDIDTTFEDEEMLTTTITTSNNNNNNIIYPHDLISLTTSQYPIFNYSSTNSISVISTTPSTSHSQLQSIANNSPIFSAPSPIAAMDISGNLIVNNDDDNNSVINKKEFLESSNINNDIPKNISTNQTISSKSLQETLTGVSSNNNNVIIKKNKPGGQSSSSTKSGGNGDDDIEVIKPDQVAKLAAEEDKRRRNTAASARFRVKKKLREQALEKTAKEMSAKAELLEGKIKELEMENKWLRSLIVEKDTRLSDVQIIVDKTKKYNGQNNNNNNKLKKMKNL